MNVLLPEYSVTDATWFYLSFLLIVSVFFKFNRLWSIRNLDLALLLGISPGLLLVQRSQPILGYAWLFVATAGLIVRMLWDSGVVRRPRLEPNMNAAGLTFLCAAAFAFLMTKVMTDPPEQQALQLVGKGNQLLQRRADETGAPAKTPGPVEAGPASAVLAAPVAGLSKVLASPSTGEAELPVYAARTLAILAHLAVILGLGFVGRSLFNDLESGVAMAALYMLLPCTAYDVSKANHVIPAALIVWAVVAYRKPLVSGVLLGLACGTIVFPIFLLPLWIAFYGRRGGLQFMGAVAVITALILASLALVSADLHSFLQKTFGYRESAWQQLNILASAEEGVDGFWRQTAYRIPVFVAFLGMLSALTIWPMKKSVSHLISHSAAIVLGIQFWFPQQGGVYVLWYLPLVLIVVFRPMLANHFAPEVAPLSWTRFARTARATQPPAVTSAMTRHPAFR